MTGYSYQRALITSPAVGQVTKLSFQDSKMFLRRGADAEYAGGPVKTQTGGKGSFELRSGAQMNWYNQTVVMVGQDKTVADGGTETTTNRTHTFTGVTSNDGMDHDNDSGVGSRKVEFEYSDRVES